MGKYLLLFLASLFIIASPILADSQTAYKDYLFQNDTYRQKYSEFSVAKTEYEKFKSLTSQTDALEKTKSMLQSRDQLLRSYLYVLNEKLNEDTGLSTTSKATYQGLIKNEVTFLENHTLLIPSIGSLGDADTVSKQLESHYDILQVSIRQIISGIALGNLTTLARSFDTNLGYAQNLTGQYGYLFSLPKQSTINRWVLQIQNKRTLYQQKTEAISNAAIQLKSSSSNLDYNFQNIMKNVAEAKQYLVEGTSFMGELATALKYQD
jgi:hypothetical protein